MDPAKLKVVELRAELTTRGLDAKGNKAVLVERLRKALENETTEPVDNEVADDLNDDTTENIVHDEKEKTPEPTKLQSPAKTSGRSPRGMSGGTPTKTTPTRASAKVMSTPPAQKSPSPTKSPIIEKSASSSPIPESQSMLPTDAHVDDDTPHESPLEHEKTLLSQLIEPVSESTEPEIPTPAVAAEAPVIPPIESEPIEQPKIPNEEEEEDEEEENDEELETATTEPLNEPAESIEETEEKSNIVNELPDESVKMEDDHTNITENIDESLRDEEIDTDVTCKPENSETVMKEINESIDFEVKEEAEGEKTELKHELQAEQEVKNNSDQLNEHEDVEMKPLIKQEDGEKDPKDQERRERKDRKRKRSTSSQDERHKSPPPNKLDDEPEIDYSRVLLSWYDSDLNLVIDKTKFLSATPMHNDGFGYVWAGARASFGFNSGKVYYEVKITHQCNVTLQDEEYPHVLRAGWSVSLTSMQLGEEKLSYGYGGTGKISTGNNFRDYGPAFGLNDILGCYLDMDGEEIVISYTLNGEDLGAAFRIKKDELEGKPLYPHVLTKNCAFVCNFGDEDAWNEKILDGYVAVGTVDIKDRVSGPQRPEKREECEMLMMCGLPGAGKTYWATNYAAEHAEKMYNIIGTNTLIDKMKVIGLPRKRNYHGRWEVLIDKCTRCLNKLLEVAATRRRNYILDQTNVYPSAQRRKMRHFYGFQRKAIVIVPTEEEFKSRIAKREAVEGKDVPDSAVLEMKANFSAPVIGESFDAVEWVELDAEEGKKLIAKYNKEGKDAGYTQQQMNKRPRFEKSNDSHRDSRDVRSSRDSRDNRDYRDRRSGYSDRNRNSTWRGASHMGGGGGSGGSGGGYRDRLSRGGAPYMRHSSSSYGSPSSGGWRGRGGGPSSSSSHRGSDRRVSTNDRRSSMNERSRSGTPRQGGGWGPMNSSSSSSYHNSSHSSGGWGGSHSSSGWSGGQSQSQGSSWGSQPNNWGGQQQNWGNWKGYGQSSYNQNNYSSQQGYGNGNWGSWNQQYYNQYWGQQQPSQSGQSTTASGQSAITSGGTTSTPSTTSTGSTYNSYPQGWQGYTQQSYYSTDSSNSSSQQQK